MSLTMMQELAKLRAENEILGECVNAANLALKIALKQSGADSIEEIKPDISSDALKVLHSLAWKSYKSKEDMQAEAFDCWNMLLNKRESK